MNPDQLEIWYHYNDVILNDNTAKTNQYEVSLFFCSDWQQYEISDCSTSINGSRNKRCLCLDTSMYCILDATGLPPKVFVTDADPGMDVARAPKNDSHKLAFWFA